jgi:hypothetical protein
MPFFLIVVWRDEENDTHLIHLHVMSPLSELSSTSNKLCSKCARCKNILTNSLTASSTTWLILFISRAISKQYFYKNSLYIIIKIQDTRLKSKQEAQGPYRSPEYHATENAFNLNACYNHMPNS